VLILRQVHVHCQDGHTTQDLDICPTQAPYAIWPQLQISWGRVRWPPDPAFSSPCCYCIQIACLLSCFLCLYAVLFGGCDAEDCMVKPFDRTEQQHTNVLRGNGIRTTAAVFYLTSSGRSACSSLYSRQAGVSGFWCHRLERPASQRHICAVTRGFQTTTQDLSAFPFLPRHYHMTRVLLSPFITTVWTLVVLAIINII